jgi:hypothetical protein
MEVHGLIEKWSLLEGDGSTKFKSIRIDSVSIPDLYIGISQERKRCLILRLPIGYIPDFQSSVKQNLSLELYKETRWIVLTLLDDQYFDLFDDLIVSIYYKIYAFSDTPLFVGELLKTYYKWSEFFQDSSGDVLSDDQIKGIYGELVYLEDLVKQITSSGINDILSSWKGPYDTGHDFEGEDLNVEVKTKSLSGVSVKISSEYQLLPEPAKQLELAVVSMERDPLTGLSIKELLFRLREIVIVKLGDYTIILKALAQKGLTISKLDEYSHLKFKPLEIKIYDCDHDDFPKIVRTSLPDAISSVSYRLNLNEVKNFIIITKTL